MYPPRPRTPGTPHPCPLSGLRSPSNGLAGRVDWLEGLRKKVCGGPWGWGGMPGRPGPFQQGLGLNLGPEGTAGEWAGVGTGSVRSLVYLRTQVRGPHDWGHPGHSWGSWAGGHVPAGRQGKEKGTRQAWGTGNRCPVGLEQHPRVPWPFRFLACLAALPGRSLVSPMCGSGETPCRQSGRVGQFLFPCSSCFSSPVLCFCSMLVFQSCL